MQIQRVLSKWAKTKALLANPKLTRFVPVTQPYTRQNLSMLLSKFGMVYIKPVNGTFGKGVIRVEHHGQDKMPYRFQSGVRKYECRSFEELYKRLQFVKLRKPYLVQQGIEMLRYAGRRFDLRVTVQKNTAEKWETTGMIGRLAHPRKIVTNYHNGGTPMTVEKLLGVHWTKQPLAAYRSSLGKLGISVAEAMAKKFPRIKEIGIDVAIDKQKNAWILEVNTMPDLHLFRKHPDPSIFRRMYRYAVRYGRYRRKTA